MEAINNWQKDKETTDLIIDNLHSNQKPLKVGFLSDPDPKLCYDFVSFDKIVEEKKTGETPITAIDGNKINYPIEINDEMKAALNNPKPAFVAAEVNAKTLPLSFLAIKEGEVEKGKEWYLSNDPKLPEDIAELMARYSWGDLKHMTKKEAKNRRKKLAKKGKDILDEEKFQYKKGKFVVSFD